MENRIQLFRQHAGEPDVPCAEINPGRAGDYPAGWAWVPLPKGKHPTVLIPAQETHSWTGFVETAPKISNNTTFRSASVPEWIQQFRTHEFKKAQQGISVQLLLHRTFPVFWTSSARESSFTRTHSKHLKCPLGLSGKTILEPNSSILSHIYGQKGIVPHKDRSPLLSS